MRRFPLLLLLLSSTATAAPKLEDYLDQFFSQMALTGTTEADTGDVRLGMLDRGLLIEAPFPEYSQGYDAHYQVKSPVIGWNADKSAAFVTVELDEIAGGMGGTTPGVVASAHGLALVTKVGGKWHAPVFSIHSTIPDKDQTNEFNKDRTPPKLARKVDKGAEAAAKLFESTFADARALAATVADRKEVVLQGSDKGDRAATGKSVSAMLASWNLKLSLRDGLQAGVVGKSFAWVAANVDAVGAKGKPAPYEVLAIYEGSGSTWKLVALSFAFISNG